MARYVELISIEQCLTMLDFLLFLPTHSAGLTAVLSYYNTTAKVNAEGDVTISDEYLQGLGTTFYFLKTSLFGAVTSLVAVPKAYQSMKSPLAHNHTHTTVHNQQSEESDITLIEKLASDEDGINDSLRESADPHIPLKPARRKEIKLTDLVPDVGYFLAGGISGITSRTATAPLDRLKVYLIAQTNDTRETLKKVKQGNALQATKHGAHTLAKACRDLWAAGGIRSLYAGKSNVSIVVKDTDISIGNGINIIKVMPESAVKFGSYEASRCKHSMLPRH